VANFQTAFTDTGGAVVDLFGAAAAKASAGSYDEARDIAKQQAAFARQATAIKQIQLNREIFQTLGKQEAEVGGAGFASSGTALDLLRSSTQQGALTKAITEEQGVITANSFEEQAAQFGAMANAARSSASGQELGGIIQGVGAVAALFA
jgi:hypothetical protein